MFHIFMLHFIRDATLRVNLDYYMPGNPLLLGMQQSNIYNYKTLCYFVKLYFVGNLEALYADPNGWLNFPGQFCGFLEAQAVAEQ